MVKVSMLIANSQLYHYFSNHHIINKRPSSRSINKALTNPQIARDALPPQKNGKSPEHGSLALLATFNLGLNHQPQRPVYLDDDVSVYGGPSNHVASGPAYASSSHHHQQAQRPVPTKPQTSLDYPQLDYGDVDAGQQSGNARYRGNQGRNSEEGFICVGSEVALRCRFWDFALLRAVEILDI